MQKKLSKTYTTRRRLEGNKRKKLGQSSKILKNLQKFSKKPQKHLHSKKGEAGGSMKKTEKKLVQPSKTFKIPKIFPIFQNFPTPSQLTQQLEPPDRPPPHPPDPPQDMLIVGGGRKLGEKLKSSEWPWESEMRCYRQHGENWNELLTPRAAPFIPSIPRPKTATSSTKKSVGVATLLATIKKNRKKILPKEKLAGCNFLQNLTF